MALTKTPIELSSTPSIVDGGNATAITIDSSENVMVNRTSVFTTAKMEIQSDAGDASTLALNSIDTDGSILEFYKAGTAVGSIQSRAGVVSTIILDPRSGSLGTGITGSGSNLSPTNGSGTEADARNDIGTSTYRFKDIYLSGGVNFSANANAGGMTSELLDDYEEGTWTPQLMRNDGTVAATDSRVAPTYVKIGRTVIVKVWLYNINSTGANGSSYWKLLGLPFASTAYGAMALAYNSSGAESIYSTSTFGVFAVGSLAYTGALSGGFMIDFAYETNE